jgi:hypothetical protein
MNVKPEAPIFQNQFDQIQQGLRLEVRETLRGDPEALGLLQGDLSALISKIFEALPLKKLEPPILSEPK